MKEIAIYLVLLEDALCVGWYIGRIVRRKIAPTLSTWIIFLAGTTLSLATYAIAENKDFASGILNTMDTIGVLVIFVSVIVWGKRDVRFRPFEKWYLVGIACVIAYGIISKDAWGSNVFTQTLISVGYAPTFHNLITQKKNTESYAVWVGGCVAGIIGLYPASIGGNALAQLYAIRTIASTMSIIVVMMYFDTRSKTAKI